MDIAFCVNDLFAPYISVTIKSICLNHTSDKVCVHVLFDSMSDSSKARLTEVCAPYDNVSIRFYQVDDSRLRGLKDTWSIYTWYRVLLPGLLDPSVHRVLYLDADTLVTGNLSSLFSMDMEGKAIACASDIMTLDDEAFSRCGFPKEKVYVCAGVMLMNLDYWREHSLAEKIIRYGFDHDAEIQFPDQDTINILCQDSKIVLPLAYGIQDGFFRDERMYSLPWSEQLLECVRHPKIVHYAGTPPWYTEFSYTVMHHRWVHCSRSLPHPVLPKYKTRGLNKYKVMLYRLLHPDVRRLLTEEAVQLRLASQSK